MANKRNVKIHRRISGFSLIEVLIASTIFSVVMVFTLASITQATSFRGKVRELRTANSSSRKVASMLTRDIQAAKGGSTVGVHPNIGGLGGVTSIPFDSGVFMYNCGLQICALKNYNPNLDSFNGPANVLALYSKSEFQVYVITGTPGVDAPVYSYRKTNVDPNAYLGGLNIKTIYLSIVNTGTIASDPPEAVSLISDPDTATSVTFTGFAPQAGINNNQPYVKFKVDAKTKNYDTAEPSFRAQSELVSTVVLRSHE